MSEADTIENPVKLADIANSLFDSDSDLTNGLPDFLADAEILGPNASGASLELKIMPNGPSGVKMMLDAKVGHVNVVFIQLHSMERNQAQGAPGTPQGAIRYFKLSLTGIEIPNHIPVLSDFKAPFDELGFFWVNSGLSADDVTSIQNIQKDGGIVNPVASPGAPDQGMVSGFHFTLSASGTILLDYPIGKTRSEPRDTLAKPDSRWTRMKWRPSARHQR